MVYFFKCTFVFVSDLYLDQEVESMASYTSWTVENNGGGGCTCRCSDAQVSTSTKVEEVELENRIPDSSMKRSIYRPPARGQRLPYWAV
jgi:hypothetical protein